LKACGGEFVKSFENEAIVQAHGGLAKVTAEYEPLTREISALLA